MRIARFLLAGCVLFVSLPGTILAANSEGLKGHAEMDVGEKEVYDSGSDDLPALNIRGFLDLGYNAKLKGTDERTSFAIGQLDFLITSQLSERISFLAETFFNNSQTSTAFILTRAVLQYLIIDAFNIKIGSTHTPIGYWNHAYHHGTWLQTTIFRPEIYLYDRAYVPIHSFGMEFFGVKDLHHIALEYHIGIFNGRGPTPPQVLRIQDANDQKAINTMISLEPRLIEGLKVGTSFYSDKIPPNPGVSLRADSMTERILGGHLAYKARGVELLGEYLNIYHDDRSTRRVYDTQAYYLQGGYTIARFTPYYRFDYIDFGGNDPFYTPNVIDIRKHTQGLRWDISTWNALKIEYCFADREGLEDERLLAINSSFTF